MATFIIAINKSNSSIIFRLSVIRAIEARPLEVYWNRNNHPVSDTITGRAPPGVAIFYA